jgi:hypothetical protein
MDGSAHSYIYIKFSDQEGFLYINKIYVTIPYTKAILFNLILKLLIITRSLYDKTKGMI